jgi:hypothetical protein
VEKKFRPARKDARSSPDSLGAKKSNIFTRTGAPMTIEEKKQKILAWEKIKHFKYSEFDDPTEKDSGLNMNLEFIKVLDTLRDKCGFALNVASGWRNKAHNKKVGGKGDSAHTEEPGMASDLKCVDSTSRWKIVSEAVKLGIKRIGIGAGFVHVDMSYKLPQEVLWLYPPKATAVKQNPKKEK